MRKLLNNLSVSWRLRWHMWRTGYRRVSPTYLHETLAYYTNPENFKELAK